MNTTRSSIFRDRLIEQFPQLNPEHEVYRWLVLSTVMIGTFMAVLDATIVNVALPKLMAAFGVQVDSAEWVITAYLLIFSVMLPSSGWFADHIGYKKILMISLFLFTLGSFLVSLSWSFDALIVFRVVQGAGAGFLLPVGMAVITREFPPERRGIALGFWGIASSASVSLGPTIGGYLIDNYSWHTIFDVNVPVGILAIAVTLIVIREHKSEDVRFFDFVGFISLAVFLTALLLALSNGNSAWNTEGWTSDFILISFAVAFIGLVVFIITEVSIKHPLIELVLFENVNFALSSLVLFIFGLGMFGSTFLLPIYLQNSLGYTTLQTGMVFLPVGVLVGVTSPIAGTIADKFSAKIPSIIGISLLALTLYQYSFLSFLSENFQIMLPLYIRGFAMGLIFSPLTAIAIAEIPNQKMAQASGLINVIRQIGGSFGVAIFGTILTQRTIFHSMIYGEQVNQYSASFKHTMIELGYFAIHANGGTINESAPRAHGLLIAFIRNQAFIEAVNDVFFIAALVVLSSVVPVFFLHGPRAKSRRKAVLTD